MALALSVLFLPFSPRRFSKIYPFDPYNLKRSIVGSVFGVALPCAFIRHFSNP